MVSEAPDPAARPHRVRCVSVAVVRSQPEAELVRMTLEAHGIEAVTSAQDPAHPSLDFVHGIDVRVRSEDVEVAGHLLGTFGLGDA
jgi:hypothetical protein